MEVEVMDAMQRVIGHSDITGTKWKSSYDDKYMNCKTINIEITTDGEPKYVRFVRSNGDKLPTGPCTCVKGKLYRGDTFRFYPAALTMNKADGKVTDYIIVK